MSDHHDRLYLDRKKGKTMEIYTVEVEYEGPVAYFQSRESAEDYIARAHECEALWNAWAEDGMKDNFIVPAEYEDLEGDYTFPDSLFIVCHEVRP